jgi:DnaK suppressor protein
MTKVRTRTGRLKSGFAIHRRALERLLRSHCAQLSASRRVLREELPAVAADVTDEVEDSVDHLARAIGVAVLEASSATVRGIEKALQRLQSGSYGSCEDCGEAIPALRLRVLPFAERCIPCQEQCDSTGHFPMPLHA